MIAAIKTQQLLPQWDLAAFTYRSLDFESFAAFFINFVKIYFTESRLTSAICAAFTFLIFCFLLLIVLRFNLEEALRMVANRALFRRILAYTYMSTVAALPNTVALA